MMKRQTVEQLLLVFRLFRENYARGKPLHKAYQGAVREVAGRHSVTYQTIADGCRRRLMLSSIRELYALLTHWMEGDAEPLSKQLIGASDPSAHDEIIEFFKPSTKSASARRGEGWRGASENKVDSFSVRLSERDARMVRALAEMEGVSASELLRQLVESAVDGKMKLVAQAILRDAPAVPCLKKTRDEILKILRNHEEELRNLGAEHVFVFGSAAREDAGPASDVDLAVRLTPGFSKGGFHYFGRFEALRARLAQILACAVDLVEEPVEKPRLQKAINEDRVLAF